MRNLKRGSFKSLRDVSKKRSGASRRLLYQDRYTITVYWHSPPPEEDCKTLDPLLKTEQSIDITIRLSSFCCVRILEVMP